MSARRKSIEPNINVTPLVDIVLVLLIIFMVVAPQLQAGAKIDLPKAKNVDTQDTANVDPLLISVTSSGEIFVDRIEMKEPRIEAHLKQVAEKTPNRQVVIKADRLVRYSIVRQLFKTCQTAGLAGASLEVSKRLGS